MSRPVASLQRQGHDAAMYSRLQQGSLVPQRIMVSDLIMYGSVPNDRVYKPPGTPTVHGFQRQDGPLCDEL